MAMFFWSIAFIWTSQLFEIGFKPLSVAFLRLVVASIFLTICTKALRIKESIRKEDYKYLFLLGFAEPFCYFLGFKYGMLFVTPTTASLFVATIPLVVPIFAWLFLKESVSMNKIIGLLVSFMGVLLIIVDDLNLGGTLVGFLLLSISVFSGAFYSILLRKLTQSYSALTLAKYQVYTATCLFMPLFFIFDFQQFLGIPFTFSNFRYFIFLGALPSSLSFVFLAMAVRQLGAIRPSIMTNVIPVFTGILAFFILKEPFTGVKVLAMSIVIIGLFISQSNFNISPSFGGGRGRVK